MQNNLGNQEDKKTNGENGSEPQVQTTPDKANHSSNTVNNTTPNGDAAQVNGHWPYVYKISLTLGSLTP